MKNFLVIGLYPKESCPVFSLELATAIKNAGNKVYAIIPSNVENKNDWINTLTEENLIFLNMVKHNKFDKYLTVIKFILNHKKILSKISDIKFDVIFYTFFHRWNVLIMRYLQGGKHLLFVHDPLPHSDEKKNRLKLQKKQIKSMTGIILLSKQFISFCKEQYKLSDNEIFFMPHCLMNYGDGNNYTVYDSNYEVNFLFFGRITKYKGVGILIDAFKKLEKLNYSAHLSIVGGGNFLPYAEEFEQLHNAEIYNYYVNDDDIQDWFLKRNTVCVLPYLDATQSGVIAIAYEFATVVIASDTGGLREQLNEGDVGIFVEPNNSIALCKALEQACNDFDMLNAQSNRMREISKFLNWDFVVCKLLSEILQTD